MEKKMRIFYIMGIFSFLSFLLFSCAGGIVTKSALKAQDVKMITCLPSFIGSESISLTPTFTITNPNDSMVSVSIDYRLEAGNQLLGKSMIPTLYVPSHETIEVKDTINIAFMGWFASEALSGKGKKQAIMLVAPVWKGLGGKRPGFLPKELWDKIPEKKSVLIAKGSILVATKTAQKMFHFENEYQE